MNVFAVPWYMRIRTAWSGPATSPSSCPHPTPMAKLLPDLPLCFEFQVHGTVGTRVHLLSWIPLGPRVLCLMNLISQVSLPARHSPAVSAPLFALLAEESDFSIPKMAKSESSRLPSYSKQTRQPREESAPTSKSSEWLSAWFTVAFLITLLGPHLKKKELERKWNTLLWMFSYRLKFVMMLAWRQGMHREG